MPKMRTDDGVEINYQVDDFRDPWITSPGDTILMSHGFSRGMKWWTQWVPALSRRYRVIRYDIRGCGESSAPPEGSEWSADRLAKDVVNLIDHLGVQKIHWVGFESGGIWGKVFAINHPDRIKSLTLTNTPSIMTGYSPIPASKAGIKGSEAVDQMGIRPWAEETIRTRFDPSIVPPELVEWHLTEQAKTPREVGVAILRVAESLDLSGKYSLIRVPTLIMVGDRFGVTPVEDQRRVQQEIPDARLVVFPRIGGGIHNLIPDQCTAEVLRFLDSL